MSSVTPSMALDGRKPTVEIKPRKGLFQLDLRSVWQYRELLYFLTWKDVKVRYKQTAIGTIWALLQPLLTMLIFTMVFSKFAKIPSDGVPYPLFALTALLPWQLFAQAVSRSSISLVSNPDMISKVYFPRLIVPVSATLGPLIDFMIAFVILMAMMAWYGVAPTWGIVALPGLIFLALLNALAICLFLSALNVKYRDVSQAVPFLVQCWMYASPVAYSVNLVPENWRFVYSLNPMAGVIEGFRWALLGKSSPDIGVMIVSLVVVIALLCSGVIYFKRMEQTFADVI